MKDRFLRTLNRLLAELKGNSGITLIEIMIVVTIIAILGGLVLPRLLDMPQKARQSAAKQQMKNFGTSLLQYNMENGSFPSGEEGLQELVNKKLIKKIPADPWGNPYNYRSPGENDPEYEIWSYGADGKPGGEDFNKDINSWD